LPDPPRACSPHIYLAQSRRGADAADLRGEFLAVATLRLICLSIKFKTMSKLNRYVLWPALSAIICTQGLSQGVPCHHGIATDPGGAVNPQCTLLLNAFDWREEFFNSNSSVAQGGQFHSPYYNTDNGQCDFLHDQTSPAYHDFEPGDGWELIAEGFNRTPPRDYAYFVLYNKHESLLRVFTTLPSLGTPLNHVLAQIELTNLQQNNSTAIFSPRLGIGQPLDTESIRNVQATNYYNNTDDAFHYFDIPVEYDPCTCTANNSIRIRFGRVSEQKIEMYGRFIATSTPAGSAVKIEEGGTSLFPPDFLTATFTQSENELEDIAGVETHKTWQKLLDQYKEWSTEHEALKKQYEKLELFNALLDNVSKSVGGPLLKSMVVAKIDTGGDQKITGYEIAQGFLGSTKLWGASLKKKVDAANNKKNELGSATFTSGEIALKGSLKSTFQEARDILFALPGSVAANCASNVYPYYNEVLGRFALLETPVANMSTASYTDPINCNVNYDYFKIDPATVNYVFNPAAKVNKEETDIFAALRIVYDYGSQAIPDFVSEGINMDTVTFNQGVAGAFISPIMPLSCLEDFVAHPPPYCQKFGEGPLDNSFAVELVLFVDYVFEDGGSAMQIYTYPVSTNRFYVGGWPAHTALANIGFSPTTAYPSALTLATTHFTSDQFIFAWSSITIAGDLTAEPGVKVEILAPDIQVLDESFIGSDIWLRDGYVPFASCEPLGEYPSSLLAAYCGGTKYKANQSLAPPPGEEALAQPPAPVPPAPGASLAALQVEAYPNPLSGYATLRLLLPEEGAVSASLSDLQGRPLRQVLPAGYLPAGEHLFDLPAHDLAPGMYLLTVQTAQGRQSIKLVKR
jgi:hypothetical protein